MKRKFEEDPYSNQQRPTKRLSMLDNTPQQWKEQRRKILKMSKQKLKSIVDVDCNLRVSVLINNTYRKMKRELRENHSPNSWQYTPKPLFPNRSVNHLLMCPSELEWERDDINSKELTPPAADLSIVLSDILGDEAVTGSNEADEEEEVGEMTQCQDNCDIMDTCDSVRQTDSAIDSSHNTEQDLNDTDGNNIEHDCVNMEQQQTEQELPINYSMQKKSTDNDNDDNTDDSSLNSNQKNQGQATPTKGLSNKSINNSEGDLVVSCKDNALTTSKQSTSSTIEDFIIGGRMDWSQNCDKVNFVYSASSIGSMLPMIDLTNITSYCNGATDKTADQLQTATAAANLDTTSFMDTTRAASIIDCDINTCNNSKVGYNNKLTSDLRGCQQLAAAVDNNNSSLQQPNKTNSNSNKENIDSESLANCDVDINQHIWACFQQFNMVIACS